MKKFIFLTMILAVSFSNGCAYSEKAYEGPERPADSVACVEAGHLDLTRKILINKIDGKPYTPSLSETEVLPGQHTMEVWYWDMVSRFPFWTSYACPFFVEFEAVAGREYKFNGEGEWSNQPSPIRVKLRDTSNESIVWEGETDASKPSFIMR